MEPMTTRPDPRPKLLPCLVGLCCGLGGTGHAQTAVPVAVVTLPVVVVSGTRDERNRDDLPFSVDAIGASAMEESQVRDIRDLAKDLPNVSVKRAPARFSVTGRGNPVGGDGNAGFGIRGQGGNRVTMLSDGIRLPRSYVNGSNAFGRDTVALELFKRIEIVRGPTSVLYGSDGLAGLVNFITYEPADFLSTASGEARPMGGKAWLAYDGDDDGRTVGGTVAGRAGATAQWLVGAATHRSGALRNMGSNDADNVERTTPNPQSGRANALLGKLVLSPDSAQRHVLTLEHVDRDGDFNLLSNRAKPPYTGTAAQIAALVVDERATKTMERNRLTWVARYKLDAAAADNLQTVLAWQRSAALDDGFTLRQDNGLRLRTTSYTERAWQLSLQADKATRLDSGWSQKTTYGLDHIATDTSSFADGQDPTPPGPYLPKKYFPDTRDTSNAIYGQSEWTDGTWSITPGVRWDRFTLDVRDQTGYFPGPSATPGQSLSGSAVSPRLGILARATAQWSVFANLASGFRAPEAQQVNNVFEGFNVKLLPNPALKPEKSRNVELGVRARMEQLSLDIAAFRARYSNLIVDKKNLGTALPGAASATNPTLFQTVNIDRATITGLEVKGSVAWGQAMGGDFTSPFGYGRARGSDDTTGRPLTSVDPARLRLGIKYETAQWDLRLDVVHRQTKKDRELDSAFIPKSSTLQQFIPPAATTLDLIGQWRLRKDLRLGLAITNLSNRKYWNWSDVQGLASNGSPVVVDAYTQPGRHLSVSLVADF